MNDINGRTIMKAILVAGTLDLLSAFAFSAMKNVSPAQVLRYVASGPFGDSMRDGGLGAALAGVAVHYSLMSVMVVVFAAVVSRFDRIRRHWYLWGVAYGFAIYLAMYWLVVPTRFGSVPKTDLWSVGNALFSHILCVGLPMAYIVARRPMGRISRA